MKFLLFTFCLSTMAFFVMGALFLLNKDLYAAGAMLMLTYGANWLATTVARVMHREEQETK